MDLPNEIIYYITLFLSTNDIINLSRINKENTKVLDYVTCINTNIPSNIIIKFRRIIECKGDIIVESPQDIKLLSKLKNFKRGVINITKIIKGEVEENILTYIKAFNNKRAKLYDLIFTYHSIEYKLVNGMVYIPNIHYGMYKYKKIISIKELQDIESTNEIEVINYGNKYIVNPHNIIVIRDKTGLLIAEGYLLNGKINKLTQKLKDICINNGIKISK